MKISHKTTDALQSLGRRLGLHLTRVENTLPFKRQRFITDLRIDTVLDVGANVGGYVAELRRNGYRGRIVSFEPIAHVYAQLEATCRADPQWAGVNAALGDVDGSAEIHLSHNDASSSLLAVTARSVDAAGVTATRGTEKIRVARLDGLARQVFAGTSRVYAKIDVQGFEKQVLAGAQGVLNQIHALELELSLVELYAGQALIAEMIELAAAQGFTPAWLERGFKDPRTGHLLQLDGIFLRRS